MKRRKTAPLFQSNVPKRFDFSDYENEKKVSVSGEYVKYKKPADFFLRKKRENKKMLKFLEIYAELYNKPNILWTPKEEAELVMSLLPIILPIAIIIIIWNIWKNK